MGTAQERGLAIHLASTGIARGRSCIPEFERIAAISTTKRHRLVDSAHDADVVLFTECHLHDNDWRLRAIAESPLRHEFADRCFVYNERDNPWCVLPGVYTSYPMRSFDPARQAAWAYYRADDVRSMPGEWSCDPDLLVSVTASPTHPCRLALFQLSHSRGVFERTDGFVFYDSASHEYARRKARHLELLSRSSFVLCPRGAGTSSIRLYEVLSAGRVPVIIADQWIAPIGPDWASFSLRWPEGRADGLVEYLEQFEQRAAEMGLAARRAYEQWFAPEVAFDRIADLLVPLVLRKESAKFPNEGVRDARFIAVAAAAGRARAGRAKHAVSKRVTPR